MDSFVSLLLYVCVSLLSLVFLVWFSITGYIYWTHRRYGHIPSPKMSSFYMGHLPAIVQEYKQNGSVAELHLKWLDECGPLYVIFHLHRPMLLPLNIEDIKLVLMNAQLPKAFFLYSKLINGFGERFMGEGLSSTLHYKTWKPRRSLYDPTFTKNNLKTMIPSFNGCADSFIEKLRAQADGKTEVLIKEEFGAVTLDVIGKVAFGTDFGAFKAFESLGLKLIKQKVKGNLNDLVLLIDQAWECFIAGFRNPFLQYWDPKRVEGYREAIRALRKIGRDLIEKRILAVEREEKVPNDILAQILRKASTQETVNVEDLVDDFVTFLSAGQETTANLLSFTIATFHQYPDILKRVLEELSEVVGERKTVSAEDLEQLTYLEQVFSEILRMYPPAVGTIRETPHEMKLSGYTIPAGTAIQVSIHAMHYNPNYWEDPDNFDPERFGADRPKPSPFIYLPFSTGHRSCIGRVFAMMEAKIIMARLLTSFKVSLREDFVLKLESRATLKPAGEMPCTLTPL